jgi:hypothetical protein
MPHHPCWLCWCVSGQAVPDYLLCCIGDEEQLVTKFFNLKRSSQDFPFCMRTIFPTIDSQCHRCPEHQTSIQSRPRCVSAITVGCGGGVRGVGACGPVVVYGSVKRYFGNVTDCGPLCRYSPCYHSPYVDIVVDFHVGVPLPEEAPLR